MATLRQEGNRRGKATLREEGHRRGFESTSADRVAKEKQRKDGQRKRTDATSGGAVEIRISRRKNRGVWNSERIACVAMDMPRVERCGYGMAWYGIGTGWQSDGIELIDTNEYAKERTWLSGEDDSRRMIPCVLSVCIVFRVRKEEGGVNGRCWGSLFRDGMRRRQEQVIELRNVRGTRRDRCLTDYITHGVSI